MLRRYDWEISPRKCNVTARAFLLRETSVCCWSHIPPSAEPPLSPRKKSQHFGAQPCTAPSPCVVGARRLRKIKTRRVRAAPCPVRRPFIPRYKIRLLRRRRRSTRTCAPPAAHSACSHRTGHDAWTKACSALTHATAYARQELRHSTLATISAAIDVLSPTPASHRCCLHPGQCCATTRTRRTALRRIHSALTTN